MGGGSGLGWCAAIAERSGRRGICVDATDVRIRRRAAVTIPLPLVNRMDSIFCFGDHCDETFAKIRNDRIPFLGQVGMLTTHSTRAMRATHSSESSGGGDGAGSLTPPTTVVVPLFRVFPPTHNLVSFNESGEGR